MPEILGIVCYLRLKTRNISEADIPLSSGGRVKVRTYSNDPETERLPLSLSGGLNPCVVTIPFSQPVEVPSFIYTFLLKTNAGLPIRHEFLN